MGVGGQRIVEYLEYMICVFYTGPVSQRSPQNAEMISSANDVVGRSQSRHCIINLEPRQGIGNRWSGESRSTTILALKS
jgi:hypothetical protein